MLAVLASVFPCFQPCSYMRCYSTETAYLFTIRQWKKPQFCLVWLPPPIVKWDIWQSALLCVYRYIIRYYFYSTTIEVPWSSSSGHIWSVHVRAPSDLQIYYFGFTTDDRTMLLMCTTIAAFTKSRFWFHFNLSPSPNIKLTKSWQNSYFGGGLFP